MHEPRFDAAVVGAGPAGAWCAHELAAAGVRVVLLDGSHPREKPCGGGVTARALALVGQETTGLGVAIETAGFGYGGHRAVVPLADGRRPRLEVFARRDFDSRLLARASAAGTTVIEDRVVDVMRSGGVWKISTPTGTVHADWLLGADGANSLVRRRVSRAFARHDLSIACGYFVHGQTSHRIDIEFVPRPAGYLWSFPRHDHLAIGICAQADEASVTTLMPIVDGWMQANVRDGRRDRYSWPIPSLTVTTLEREVPSGDGWMLLGDAAGLVDPITREGIFFALQSAQLAAASLTSAADPATAYLERVREAIYSELMRAARLKARFYRPTFMSLLLSALQRSQRIGGIMADLVAGEQPYHSLRGRLLKTCEFRLMWDLLGLQRT